MVEQNSFFIVRTWIGLSVMLLIGIAFAPSRTFAQAGDGPQTGATPSDQPSSTQHAVPQIGGHPSLAGTWTLNKDQSDDPREKMREAMGGGNGGGGGNGNGGGYGGGGGRGMGGGRRGGGGGGQNQMNAEFSQLTIAQTATSAKVTGSSGRVLAQYSGDNSSQSANSASSNSGDANNSADSGTGENQGAPAAAQWQGSQLVATTQGRRGGSTSRTYELSPDATQLYVITKVDNPRLQQPVTFRFVYDAAKSNGGGSR